MKLMHRLLLFPVVIVFVFCFPSFAQELKEVNSLINSSQYEPALALIDKKIKSDKKNALLYSLKGKVNFLLGEQEESKSKKVEYRRQSEMAFKKAMKYDKNNVTILNDYGLLKKYQGYSTEAERTFKKVLKIEKDNFTAYSFLVELNKTNKGKLKDYEKKLLDLDFKINSVDSKICLFYIYAGLEQWKNAELVLIKAKEADRDRAEIYLCFTEVYYNLNNDEEMTGSYYEYLSKLKIKDSGGFNNIYYDIMDIMTEEDQAELKNTSFENTGKFLLKFWKEKDANPLTPENERLKEHLRRLKYARENYKSFEKWGYDQRGRWYVRLGPPEDDYKDPGGGAVMINAGGGEKIIHTPANESWSYRHISPHLAFDFLEKAGTYEIVDYFNCEGSREMYMQRVYLGGDYVFLATSNNFASAIKNTTTKRHEAVLKIDSEMIDYFIPEYSFEPDLKYIFDVCQFRGKNGATVVEVYYGLYNGQLKPEKDEFSSKYNTGFTIDLLVKDENYNEVYENQFIKTSAFNSLPELKRSVSVDQDRFTLDRGDYGIFVQIIEENENRGGQLKKNITVKDFSPDTLTVSGIQFSDNVQEVQSEGKFTKNGLNIIPYPFKEIGRDKNIHSYFEVYNLTLNNEGKTDFEISYSVKKKQGNLFVRIAESIGKFLTEEKQWAISSTFTRKGSKRDSYEHILFDFSTLEKGEFVLTISIKDNITNRLSQTIKEFKILD